ncbi:unnamed protein product, partial [Rotaria sp. Silwood1]
TTPVDPTTGTITATDLAISDKGMYIIKLQITSSNGQYSIQFTSNGILVKENSTVLEVFTGFPTTYMTYNADYDALESEGKLEQFRATLYNYYTINLKLPVSSDIILRKGSVLAAATYSTSGSSGSQAFQTGISNMLSNPSAVSGAQLSSINHNSRVY